VDIGHVLWVLVISAAPIGELRAGIPLGIKEYDLSWAVVVPVALAGNLVIVPFLLLFLERGLRFAYSLRLFNGILDWIFEHSRKRAAMVEKYHSIGLFLLVAIPLPGTGAWTGSLVASLLHLEPRRSLPPIVAGVLAAAAIVSVLTALGWVGAAIAVACVLLVVGIRVYGLRKHD